MVETSVSEFIRHTLSVGLVKVSPRERTVVDSANVTNTANMVLVKRKECFMDEPRW